MYSTELECPAAEPQLRFLGKTDRFQEEKGVLLWGSQHAKQV